MKLPLTFALAALAAPLAAAPQDICEGNGFGNCYISTTAARIGGTLEVDMGSPGLAGGFSILSISDGYGPSTHPSPLVGFACLDFFTPAYKIYGYSLDGTGNVHFSVPVPAIPTLVGAPPIFANGLTVEGGQFSIAKTVRVAWENPDSFTPVASMGEARIGHSVTQLGSGPRDNRTKVLIAGGGSGILLAPLASNTTEIYEPMQRLFRPGPNMSVARYYHTATKLPDGRVLLAGGAGGQGIVTNTCEIFDPNTETLSPASPMNFVRSGHAALLLNTGQVLVTGGLSDYFDAGPRFGTVMNSSQDTVELYDPVLDKWTLVPFTMQQSRSGHTMTLLNSGDVLIVGGVRASSLACSPWASTVVPVFAATCDVFLSGSATIVSGPNLPIGRGFHSATKMNDGRVLVVGGASQTGFYCEALASSECWLFDGPTSSWTQVGSLAFSVSMHAAALSPTTGDVIIQGGIVGDFGSYTASSQVGAHNGNFFTTLAPLGENPGLPLNPAVPRGHTSLALLADNTFLVSGGINGATTYSDAFVYIEP